MLVADANEPVEIVSRLRELGLEVEVKRLDVGDYLATTSEFTVAFERKTAEDYISSLETGRLNNQAYQLSVNFPISFLCIIGSVSYALSFRKINRKAYISSISSIALKRAGDGCRGQVIPLQFETEYDFTLFVKCVHDQLCRGEFERVPKLKAPGVGKGEKFIMLTAIPGIGERKARKIYEHFGSIEAVVKASVQELMEVEGIGVETARKIYEFFR